MKLRIIILTLGLALIAGCSMQSSVEAEKLTIESVQGTHVFNLDIAQTDAERQQGLMDRAVYPDDSAMLFIFKKPSHVSMWMKNTLIPLDMLMVDENKRITQIFSDVEPCQVEACPRYTSSKKSLYVVEINGGLSQQLGIDIGDMISF